MDAERCTLFQYDEATDELWSKVFSGPRIEEIRVRNGEGIAGYVMQTGEWVRIADAASDPRFQSKFDRKTGFVTRSVLCVPLINVQGRRIGVVQVINKHRGEFVERDAELLAALNAQAAIAIENGRLYEELRTARAKEVALAAELAAKHRELQNAFRELEQRNQDLKVAVGVAHRLRLAAGAAVVVLFGLLVAFAWRRAAPAGEAVAAFGPSRIVEVAAGPLEVVVPMAGRIEPLDLVTVVSPISGAVSRVSFRYGERVAAGAALLELDTTQIEVEERSARAAMIRAAQRVRELEQWQATPRVSDARRDLSRAELALEAARRRLAEISSLYEKGIVRREEFEAARDAQTKAELDYRSEEEALGAVVAQGSGENLEIARMELQNTRVALERIEERRRRATVAAPTPGVVLLPSTVAAGGARGVEEGGRVEAGEPLLAIGNLEKLGVVCRVDEVDVARVRLGQPVRVRSEALGDETLAGAVRSVSSQASAQGEDRGMEVVIELEPVSAERVARFRLGLSADVEVVAYRREAALMIPLEAVRSDVRGAWVERLDEDGDALRRDVTLGETTVDAVEVVAGLAPGDRLRVPVI
jgi:multidrug efflux pump subunit AcrA (membrane-fusion protein)/putative methionine-R-sulfoxide reductase with GAF domain